MRTNNKNVNMRILCCKRIGKGAEMNKVSVIYYL